MHITWGVGEAYGQVLYGLDISQAVLVKYRTEGYSLCPVLVHSTDIALPS